MPILRYLVDGQECPSYILFRQMVGQSNGWNEVWMWNFEGSRISAEFPAKTAKFATKGNVHSLEPDDACRKELSHSRRSNFRRADRHRRASDLLVVYWLSGHEFSDRGE